MSTDSPEVRLADILTLAVDGVRLPIRLTPGASKDSLDGFMETADGLRLKAGVTAVPEKGKANAAIAKLLAKKLRLPKTSIRLIAGEQSRNKTVLIEGVPDELLSVLDAKFRDLGLLG
ncbi:DUF167 domain-containing protein [Kordiimonas aestuarii]|uniref:DUF167 domain-containing protein n=1 Tax=Kordiimonas aestuarii TaxID=1005925 RepID=UPI0021D0030D|nr:DUF167 domain-containing protein [Kordiimonas aestuarii]